MSTTSLKVPTIIDLGLMSYGSALERQNFWHEAVVRGEDPVILTVEHQPVLTLGKNSSQDNLLFSREYYHGLGIEIFETERGGEVTAHLPGQLVVYPIIDVNRYKLSVRDYIYGLESAVIETLKTFGIVAERDPQLPGVWVGSAKICAIGVRIKSRVTMHGLALNVDNNLDIFSKIVPCGIRARGVTSMSTILNKNVSLPDVRSKLLKNLIAKLSDVHMSKISVML
jgi:lipoyl(octanoyl) transferase